MLILSDFVLYSQLTAALQGVQSHLAQISYVGLIKKVSDSNLLHTKQVLLLLSSSPGVFPWDGMHYVFAGRLNAP